MIFSTVKEALHGHPTPLNTPPGVARRSLALYYYANTWEPAVQERTTQHYISQKHRGRIRLSRIVRGFILDLIPPIFRKTFRAIKRAIKGEKLTELWNQRAAPAQPPRSPPGLTIFLPFPNKTRGRPCIGGKA